MAPRQSTHDDTLSSVTTVVDPEPYWDIVDNRFGISRSTFDAYTLVRPNKKKVYIVPKDHAPPQRPQPQSLGLPFMRVYLKYPKLTTAAAMTFGTAATRNVIHADAPQADAYLTRRDFYASAEQIQRCTGKGYVLVQYRELILGVGFFIPDEPGGTVESMLPKTLARAVGLEASGGVNAGG